MGKFITFILKLSIFFVFLVTVYFSLDFFEIVEVPKKYSLVELLDSKIDMVSAVQDYVQLTLQDKNLEDIYNSIKLLAKESTLGSNALAHYLKDKKDLISVYDDDVKEYLKTLYPDVFAE